MNSSIWMESNSSTSVYLSLIIPVDQLLDRSDNTTLMPLGDISDKPCGQALSSHTPASVKLPGSLDALLYIVIVLMFYAFSIVVLMVKYIRREREEASLRNYYHEFVSREKFRSAQYKNSQFMKRIFGSVGKVEEVGQAVTEECVNITINPTSKKKTKSVPTTITRNGNTFSKLLLEGSDGEEKKIKESFTFLSAKNQFCKRGFFGKKFCNKQLCSKCVTEGAPTIDWGDEKGEAGVTPRDKVEIRIHHDVFRSKANLSQGSNYSEQKSNSSLERDNIMFFPIIECESEKGSDDVTNPMIPTGITQKWESKESGSNADFKNEEQAIVSSCSLEVFELLANMPPLGAFSNSNDMDTLDGLSNLDSEAESQSLLNYSTSIRGTDNIFSSQNSGGSPRAKVATADDCRQMRNSNVSDKQGPLCDGTHKDLSDFLSERTSLLSCTLSIANEVDEDDGVTNQSSFKNYNKEFSHSNSNGKIKEEFAIASGKLKEEIIRNSKSNLNNVSKSINGDTKSILNSVSKSINGDEEEMMRLLTNITMITEESGLFKNLKYFLRSFSKHEHVDCPHEKTNLLPKETYFGPGSPKSVFCSSLVPTKYNPECKPTDYSDINSLDNECLNMDESERYGNRWGYANDEDDDLYSDGGRSSSFGDYCMGDATDSQVIDLSGPLVRRQLDSETRNGLSRAFIGLDESWQNDDRHFSKTNPMLAGYGSARKETKV